MKKRKKKRFEVNNFNYNFSKIFVISIIMALVMIMFMLIYSKYFYLIPIGYKRFLIYDLTILIPVIAISIIGSLLKLGPGSISDFIFYIISFMIYSLISFVILIFYKKFKPNKRKRYVLILFLILIFYLLIFVTYQLWGLYY